MNTNLVNNTENFNEPDLNFTYQVAFSGTPRIDDFGTVTLFVNEVLNLTLFNVNVTALNRINLSLDTVEMPLNISINASAVDWSADSGLFHYNVDTIPPRINQTGLINNSDIIINTVLNTNVTIFDPNLFAYNISLINLDTSTVLENYFAENLTVQIVINDTSRILSTLGNFTFNIKAWDSHTVKKIKPYVFDQKHHKLF